MGLDVLFKLQHVINIQVIRQQNVKNLQDILHLVIIEINVGGV